MVGYELLSGNSFSWHFLFSPVQWWGAEAVFAFPFLEWPASAAESARGGLQTHQAWKPWILWHPGGKSGSNCPIGKTNVSWHLHSYDGSGRGGGGNSWGKNLNWWPTMPELGLPCGLLPCFHLNFIVPIFLYCICVWPCSSTSVPFCTFMQEQNQIGSECRLLWGVMFKRVSCRSRYSCFESCLCFELHRWP